MTKAKANLHLQRALSHRAHLFEDYVRYASFMKENTHDEYIVNTLKKDIREINERISRLQRIAL